MDRPKLTPRQKMKSSPEARRLIRVYLKRYRTQRAASHALHMTQGQLNGLLHGRLKDTPAIKVALARADNRAKRAWLKVEQEAVPCSVDEVATLRAARRALGEAQIMIDAILHQHSSGG